MADLFEHELALHSYDEDNLDSRYADEMDMLREWEEDLPKGDSSSRFKVLRPSKTGDDILSIGTEDGSSELPRSKNDIESRSNSPLPLQIVCEEHDTQSSNPDIFAKRDVSTTPLNSVENDSYVESGYSDVQGEESDTLTTPLELSNKHPATETPGASLASLTRRGRVYTRVPPGPHVSLTGSTGNRVYLKMCTADELRLNVKKTASKKCQLLAMPFQHLKKQVEEERLRRSVEESHQFSEDSCARDDGFGSEAQSHLDGGEGGDEKPNTRVEQMLWVEKYAPSHFTQLLSDDGTNRTLLSWLKLWDKIVFGRSSTKGATTGISQVRKSENHPKNGRKSFPSRFEYQDPKTFSNPEALDPTGRPKLKIALLCGPPGLGKTTLAHIIAKHAGYNVIELNASDDRSPETFRQRIASSTQMQAVLNADSRPNCLVIDEIDGAPAPSIAILLELIKRKEPLDGAKKKGKELLSRPIVCICNDQYVPALRELRQHALVLVFPPTLQSRLSHRLQEVCRREKLRVPIPALTALCDKADNDIRSCLNTLQFLKRRMTEITVSVVQNASVGQKDAQKNLFTLWKDIFQLPSIKKQSMVLRRSQKEISKSDRFLYILSTVMSVGEYDKVVQGVFENYPNIRYRDPSMRMTTNVLEWIVFQDTVDKKMVSTQNYSLLPYLPFAPVAAHIYLASSSNARVHYPHQQYELVQNVQRSNNIIESLLSEMPPKTRNFMTRRSLTVEMLPLVVETLAPTLRPVSVQLYSAKEKQLLSDLVNTMISFNLTYHQERSIEGQYVYCLEPNIDLLVRFSGLPQRRQLTYAAKQLISREVEMEKMRRAERVLHKGQQAPDEGKEPSGKYTSMLKSSTPKRMPLTVTEMVQTERTPARLRKRKAAMDFFTRASENKLKKRKDITPSRADSKAGSIRHPLWFRYNEGFLNAVRRPIKIRDFL